MERALRDLRHGAHLLARSPGFTAAVLLTLALGIGANSAIFSVVNAVLIRPLPYGDPGRLVMVSEIDPQGADDLVAPANYLDWRRLSRSFEGLAGVCRKSFSMSGDGGPVLVRGASSSANLFAVLDVSAQVGRTFSETGTAAEGELQVVLSHGFWQNHFGSDPAVLGRRLELDSQSYTVTGVLPADFHFFSDPDLFVPGPHDVPHVPLAFDGDVTTLRGLQYFQVIGRLKSDVSLEQARAELQGIAQKLAQDFPDNNKGRSAGVKTLQERMFGSIRPRLLLLFGAVFFVLLVACANVINLLLTRMALREREIAIRTALGAGRGQIVRQFLNESVLLALLGGVLGLVFGLLGVQLLIKLSPGDIPRLDQVGLDANVMAFTLLLSLLTGLFVGLIPALQASRGAVSALLKEGSTRSVGSLRQRGFQSLFVVSEIAVTLMLLVGAGLLVKSFLMLRAVDPGFDPSRALTFRITLPEAKYSERGSSVRFFEQVIARIEALPGVVAVGAAADLPTTGSAFISSFTVEGFPEPGPGEKLETAFHTVTPGYFRALGIPLLAGRDLDERDQDSSDNVVVVNRTLAERFWPGTNPVGRRLGFGKNDRGETNWVTIIGMVGDARYAGLDENPGFDVFASFRQAPENFMSLIVRSTGDPSRLVPLVKEQILAVDKEQPIDRVQTLEELLAAATAEQRFLSWLVGSLAGVALVLALVGTYGIMSFSVAHRTRELGIRMALGAQRSQLTRMIVREATVLAAIGVTLGLFGAFGLTRTLAGLLFEISALDPAVFAVIPIILILVILLASYIPARRAMRVDPVLALQRE